MITNSSVGATCNIVALIILLGHPYGALLDCNGIMFYKQDAPNGAQRKFFNFFYSAFALSLLYKTIV